MHRQTNGKNTVMKNQNKQIEVAIYNIVRETEKAVCLNLLVSYNGNTSAKEIWFPKSVCELKTVDYDNKPRAFVADWFLHKAESANAFNGYAMRFETAFWN